jgi:hypothetical protein
MKNILYLLILSFVITFTACDNDDTEDISYVTTYANIDFEKTVIVAKGGAFTPSAVATEGETELDVTIDGSVDVNTIGVYIISYSATNSDGFSATKEQTVIVHDPSVVGTDVSGNIYDVNSPSRTGEIYLIEGTTSMFYCTDMGGSGVLPLYFQMDGDVMYVVDQPYNYSTVNDAEGTYDPVTKTFDVTFSTGWNYVFAYN